jgi:hypothetical protein
MKTPSDRITKLSKERIRFQAAQLRHAFAQLKASSIPPRMQPEFAEGLIAPVIRLLEQLGDEEEKNGGG